VFSTGTYRWEALGELADLVELGEEFREVTPSLKPLFVNLPDLEPTRLEAEGGYFGRVLQLVRQRRARAREFRELLGRVVAELEPLADEERLRWLDLLSYLHALVYHERAPTEHGALQGVIEASVGTDEHRQELREMRKTIADVFRDEGRQLGRREEAISARRETLLRQLTLRFKKVPPATEQVIRATTDLARLDAWLDALLTARTLRDVGIR
jgi:hypothetical protein